MESPSLWLCERALLLWRCIALVHAHFSCKHRSTDNSSFCATVDDLRDLKNMADDMNRIVYEQQTFFDESEKNIAEADESITAGASEIKLVRSTALLFSPFSPRSSSKHPFTAKLSLTLHHTTYRLHPTTLRTARRFASLSPSLPSSSSFSSSLSSAPLVSLRRRRRHN